MPELHEDAAACLMHGFGDHLPAGNLRRRPDAGSPLIADAVWRDVGRLCEDEARRGALDVVVPHDAGGHPVIGRAGACQRRHEDAAGQVKIPDPDRVEQSCHRWHILPGGGSL
jgi:hypothetical protein